MNQAILTTMTSMYNGNIGQIDNFVIANREIQQTLGNINDSQYMRNNRRVNITSEYSIEVLQSMHNQNITQIERLMVLNREIQRAIISNANASNTTPTNTPNPNMFTYEFFVEEPAATRLLGRTLLESFMEPVEIRPTQEQIDSATMRVKYGEISRPGNTTCPISLDTFLDEDDVIVIRHCGHIFKPTEFDTWFSSNCRCPTCRYDIRT